MGKEKGKTVDWTWKGGLAGSHELGWFVSGFRTRKRRKLGKDGERGRRKGHSMLRMEMMFVTLVSVVLARSVVPGYYSKVSASSILNTKILIWPLMLILPQLFSIVIDS